MTGGVVDYDEQWPVWFAEIRDALPAEWAVEHVGSTSVLGLAAKPIIDVDVVVDSPNETVPAIAALEALGWMHEGDLGVAGREAFAPRAGLPPHHLYLVLAGGVAHRDHVDLRDYLRDHPGDAARYADVKRAAAHLLERDRAAYGPAKAEIIRELLRAARSGEQLEQ